MAAPASLSPAPVELKRYNTKQRRQLLRAVYCNDTEDVDRLADAELEAMPIEQWVALDVCAISEAVQRKNLRSTEAKRLIIKAVFGQSMPIMESDLAAMPFEDWVKVDNVALHHAVRDAVQRHDAKQQELEEAADEAAENAQYRGAIEAFIAEAFPGKPTAVVSSSGKITGGLEDPEFWCRPTNNYASYRNRELMGRCETCMEVDIQVSFTIEKPPLPPVATSTAPPTAPQLFIKLIGTLDQELQIDASQHIKCSAPRGALVLVHNMTNVYPHITEDCPQVATRIFTLARQIASAFGVPDFVLKEVPIKWVEAGAMCRIQA